ncbi:hypothetical protein BDU57DRAFT_524414 [Ampelomyces quisqualis]|uniref:Uncharacterized protein n=1 Tax=Ampelomyces quisqualis TaxID=50730 RepID=A0A6A5Q718_AMPQU|nr:hypothetical protein BDU57DRAFT_524414 [Ampelomyces quisqualis]
MTSLENRLHDTEAAFYSTLSALRCHGIDDSVHFQLVIARSIMPISLADQRQAVYFNKMQYPAEIVFPCGWPPACPHETNFHTRFTSRDRCPDFSGQYATAKCSLTNWRLDKPHGSTARSSPMSCSIWFVLHC